MAVTEQVEDAALEIARLAYGGVRKDTPEWARCIETAQAILTGKSEVFAVIRPSAVIAFEAAAEFNRNYPIGTDGTIDGIPTQVAKEALVFPNARDGETVMAWFANIGWREVKGFQKKSQSVTVTQELMGLGQQARNQGKTELAEYLYKAAISSDPSYWHAYNDLGAVYNFVERHHDAIEQYSKALEYMPNSGEILNNRGMSYRAVGEPELALKDCTEALRWLPGHSLIALNKAAALDDMNMIDECLAIVRDHVRVNPDNVNIQYNLGLLLLSAARFDEGWEQYDWRLKLPTATSHYEHYDIPRWRGEDLNGKSIFVWPEQGLGDEIMTVSMLPELINRGANVTLMASTRLIPIFARSFPAVNVITRTPNTAPEAYRREPLPAYLLNARLMNANIDFQASQADLGKAFRRSLGEFKRSAFLLPNVERVEFYRKRLREISPNTEAFIGVSWNSHRNIRIGKLKGTSLESLLPLFRTKSALFVNLQYGDTRAERDALKEKYGVDLIDFGVDPLVDIDEHAALIAALDGVVTVSNTTAHVAGAVGQRVWMLCPEGPGRLWYHFRSIDHSPWYSDVTYIRQTGSSLWDGAISTASIAVRTFFGLDKSCSF